MSIAPQNVWQAGNWGWVGTHFVDDVFVEPTDGYSPEDPEDAYEPVGPYTAEDIAFLVNAQVEGDVPECYSDDPNNSL
jgi:hypothetical protein